MDSNFQIRIQVTDVDSKPVEHARVIGGKESIRTDKNGFTVLQISEASQVTVEASGFAAQSRFIDPGEGSETQLFILGTPDMPYFFRGGVMVPFRKLPGMIGVTFDSSTTPQMTDDERVNLINETAKELRVSATQVPSPRGIWAFRLQPEDETTVRKFLDVLDKSTDVEASGMFVTLGTDNASFLTRSIIARFDEKVKREQVDSIIKPLNLEVVGVFEDLGNVYKLRFTEPATYSVLNAANALARNKNVMYSEPDLMSSSEDDAVQPSDFLFPLQWDHKIIGTTEAWAELSTIGSNYTYGSPDIVIAVVDQGIDPVHPDFSGNVSDGQPKLAELFDFTRGKPGNGSLNSDHGIACASAATANTSSGTGAHNSGTGIAGVAGNCRVIGIKRPAESASDSLWAGIYLWAAGFDPKNPQPSWFPAKLTKGADVITSSFGISSSTKIISSLMKDVFDTLTSNGRSGRGVLLFFSAGNGSINLDVKPVRPWSMYQKCFGVAASTLCQPATSNGTYPEIKAPYSNFGSTIAWCAPSANVTDPGRSCPKTGEWGAITATKLGTANPLNPSITYAPGNPQNEKKLSDPVTQNQTSLTLNNVSGVASGQAVMIGMPISGNVSSGIIINVDTPTNKLTFHPKAALNHQLNEPVFIGDGYYRSNFGGTSYSTPVSAGVGALILSADPCLRWDEVRDILRETCEKIDPDNSDPVGRWTDINGKNSSDPNYKGPHFSKFFGHGRINAAAAVRKAISAIRETSREASFEEAR